MIHTSIAHITIPGVKPRRFLHISDAHLSCSYPGDSAEDAAFAEKQAQRWGTEGRTTRENFEDFLALAEEMRPDGLVMAGDCIDYYHPSCLRYLTEKLAGCPAEPLYIYGNHEGASYQVNIPDTERYYPMYEHLMGPDPSFWVKDYGDLLVVGADNSRREITPRQMELLEAQMSRGIPMILVIHIPVITEAIVPAVKQFWGEGGDQYFLLGIEGHSETTKQFCQRIARPDSPVAAILAGHVHFCHDGEFAPGRRQYTAAPGMGWDVQVN